MLEEDAMACGEVTKVAPLGIVRSSEDEASAAAGASSGDTLGGGTLRSSSVCSSPPLGLNTLHEHHSMRSPIQVNHSQ